MQERRQYANAPIVDATIDLVCSFSSAPSLEALRDFSKRHLLRFPNANDMRSVNIALVANSAPEVKQQDPIGLRLATDKGDRVLLLRTNGFAFGHGAPYTSWEEFSAEVKVFWREYVDTFSPSEVTRYAVRYINRIVIPEPRIEVNKYFRLRPEIPEDFNSLVDQMFMQMRFALPRYGDDITVVSNVGLAEPNAPDKVSFILDFDVFSTKRLPVEEHEIFEHLNKLRDVKNELFELSITDATRDLFS